MSEGNDIRKLQLELGGSFFELIEFALTRNIRGRTVKGMYGVNVAKVREVVRMPKINPLAARVKGVAGVFELRGIPIPAVNLSVALGDADFEARPNQQIIVTEFSQKRAGFIVDATNRIRRISWDKVLPPSSDAGSCITGMTLVDNNEFLFILDLEKILINMEFGQDAGRVDNPYGYAPVPSPQPRGRGEQGDPNGPRILLVEDSNFIRQGVRQMLQKAGFRVAEAGDGVDAMTMLEKSLKDGPAFDLVISDVEMPRMDGLTFTRKVREHAKLKDMPILLHTSLSGKANQSAGLSVGANGYVIKNDFATLFELIRELLGRLPDAASA